MIISNSNEGSEKLVISIIGQICGEGIWYDSDAVILNDILEKEKARGSARPLEIWLASPGGDLEAALPMVASLSAYPASIEIHTCGLVASAATLLLCADDAYVIAHKGSVFMVHLASAWVSGNANDLKKGAEMLEAFDSEIVNLLAGRLTIPEDEIKTLVSNETWLTSARALELGFVDEISDKSANGETVEKVFTEPEKDPDEDNADIKALFSRIDAIDQRLSGVEDSVKSVASAAKNTDSKLSACFDAVNVVNSGIKTMKGDIGKLDKSVSRSVASNIGVDLMPQSKTSNTAGVFELKYDR